MSGQVNVIAITNHCLIPQRKESSTEYLSPQPFYLVAALRLGIVLFLRQVDDIVIIAYNVLESLYHDVQLRLPILFGIPLFNKRVALYIGAENLESRKNENSYRTG